jgi:hypothetical protein
MLECLKPQMGMEYEMYQIGDKSSLIAHMWL